MSCRGVCFLLIIGALAALAATEINAANIFKPASCMGYLKGIFLEKFKAGLEKTSVAAEFREATERIKQKYEHAAEKKYFDPNNEDEASKYYYQLALAEVKRIKQHGVVAGEMSHMGAIELPEGMACRRDEMRHQDEDEDADYDMMDMDMEDTGATRLDLENELDRLNDELESEMGWSMTPEARARMNEQAKKLAHELLQNEVRDLALAAITGLLSGGVGGAISPVWSIVSGSLKLKIVKYFVQMLLELLSTYLGTPIQVEQPMAAAA